MDLQLNSMAERQAAEAQKYDAFSSLSLGHLRGQVAEALTAFGRLGLLEEYTKHDISHIDAMLDMYEWLIPDQTKAIMTPADWLLITLTTYLHDFGLLVTRNEFDARDRVDAFATYKKRILENEEASTKDYRAQVASMQDGDSAERFLYQEFVRANHAGRIRAWLSDTPDLTLGGDQEVIARLRSILQGVEETFVEDIAIVCESHHLDDINDTKKYPVNRPYGRGREQEANVQYAAFLLRTSDLFHITSDRVPSMAAIVINPRNPKSQVEWAKQSAVRSVRAKPVVKDPGTGDGEVLDTIEVHATFKESEGYFGLTSYLQYAGKQLAQTWLWSRENQLDGTSKYEFPWRRVDTVHIEAKGFVAEPFEFSIDQGKILDLLTGHTLYNDTGVVVRELVQNALDAVRLRSFLEGDDYRPRIVVRWDSSERVLEVTDNGVGMTQSVIVQNFLKVGSSRYQEPEFRKEHPDFAPISRFGIGVLSTFMVADDVSVATSHESESQARQLSLRDVHGQYLVRLVDKQSDELPELVRSHGTSVRLKLRPSAPLADVEETLRYWVLFPQCELTLISDGGNPENIGFESVAEALLDSMVAAGMARIGENGSLSGPYGSKLEIRTVSNGGTEVAFAVTWSRWLEEWQYLQSDLNRDEGFDEDESPRFGICVGGVRVTTEPPGFLSGGIVAMANTTGTSAPRTNVARSDLERTDEYDNLLDFLYRAYVSHILHEIKEMETSRAASLTRAAQEASYLAEDFARYEPAGLEIRDNALRTVPAFVVEENGLRKSRSLSDLESEEKLATIESTSIASLEGVLRSVRGTESASLRNLLDALGSDETLPDVPLIGGMGGSRLTGRMFTSEWEVVRLETDEESRVLKAEWRRRTDPPRWQRVSRRPALPANFLARLDRESVLGRNMSDMSWMLLANSDGIDVSNVKKDLVICQRRLLVLPGSPFLAINAASEAVTDQGRLWCIGWIIASTTNAMPRTGNAGRTWHPGEAQHARSREWVDAVLRSFGTAGIFEMLEEASVRSVLDGADLDVFDVSRWDQRQAPG